jgi:hypothetical protein
MLVFEHVHIHTNTWLTMSRQVHSLQLQLHAFCVGHTTSMMRIVRTAACLGAHNLHLPGTLKQSPQYCWVVVSIDAVLTTESRWTSQPRPNTTPNPATSITWGKIT